MPIEIEKKTKILEIVNSHLNGDYSTSSHSRSNVNKRRIKKSNSVGIFRNLMESEYSLSKFKDITGQSIDQILNANKGIPFDSKELLVFQNKQDEFGGIGGTGETNFIIDKQTNTISTEIYNDGATKKYIFRKLIDNDTKTMNNYVVFIHILNEENQGEKILMALSNIFDNNAENKTKVLSDFIDRIDSYGL